MMEDNRTWCFSCVTDLEPGGEALQCAYCSNWQHLKCAKGVSQSFFTKFYLAVMNREKPAYWECQDCTEHQSVLAPLKVPLLVPSKVRRDSNIQDEINFGFGVPLTAEVLIKPRTVIEDVHSVFPTAYCLYREQSGAEKVVRDIHGNVFRTTWLYVDDTETYQCCHFGCQFQVQVSEKRGVFFTSKENNSHKHGMRPIEYLSDVQQPLTAKTAKPTKPSQPVFTAKTAKPTKPSQPVLTAKTAKPTKPSQPVHTAKPTKPSQPVFTAKTAKPTKPSQPVLTAKTAKPTKPSQPVFTAKTAKPTKPSQPVFTAKTAKPTKPSQPVFTAKTAKPTKPSQPVFTAKTANPTKPSQPVFTAKTANPTKPSQPVPTAKPTKPSQPVFTAKTAKPTKPSQPVFTAKTAKPTKPSQPVFNAKTAKSAQPGLYRATKRQHEDCSDSFDDSIPAKIFKAATDCSFSCDSDSDDSLASSTLCDELSEDSDFDLEPETPPSSPVCQKSDKQHVEPEMSSDITYSLSTSVVTGKGTKSILTDSHGYTYQIKHNLEAIVSWTCTKSHCHVIVIQQQNNQSCLGVGSHDHGPNQSQTTTGTAPTSEAPGDQSQTSTSQGPTSKPDFRRSRKSTLGNNRPLFKKSKSAKRVKSTAPAKKARSTAPDKQKAPSPTLPLSSSPANQLICQRCDNEATFQEVSLCPRYGRKEQSYLIDPEYHIFKTKIGDEEKWKTTWKCTYMGEDGTKCPAMVKVDYLLEFNMGDHYFYKWTYVHNNHSHIRLTQPHNHGPDKATAVDLIIKANIHKLIFGHETVFNTPADIITNAYDWLHDHESLEAPSRDCRRYKRYIYRKKNEFRRDFGFYHYNYRIWTSWSDQEEEEEEENKSTEDELTDEKY